MAHPEYGDVCVRVLGGRVRNAYSLLTKQGWRLGSVLYVVQAVCSYTYLIPTDFALLGSWMHAQTINQAINQATTIHDQNALESLTKEIAPSSFVPYGGR